MKRFLLIALILLAAAGAGAGASFVTTRVTATRANAHADCPVCAPKGPAEMTAWMNAQLGLAPEQARALAPAEQRFLERHRNLTATLDTANRDLAASLREDGRYSERVASAVDRIHTAQGELQKATLERIFEMKGTLRPEQYQCLLTLASDALCAQCCEPAR